MELRLFETLLVAPESRRAVSHRRIEPSRVEIVSEIVVCLDVLACLAGGIVAQPMRERVDQPEQSLRTPKVAERGCVRGEQLKNLHRIGARPFAQRPGLVPADRARSREAHQRHPARKLDNCPRAALMEAEGARRAIGKRRIDSADAQPLVNLGKHFRESRGGELGKSSSAGGEAPVRAHQMFAARAHDGRVMNLDADCRAG